MVDRDRYSGQFRPAFSRIHHDADLLWVVPFRVRYILGIVGYRWVGKSIAMAHLAERKGFRLYTLSMTLRQTAEQMGQPLWPRTKLQDFGDQLRKEEGANVLAIRTLRQIRADFLSHQTQAGSPPRIVVGGFKRREEIDVFAVIPEFSLVALTTDDGEGNDLSEIRCSRGEHSGQLQDELARAGGDPDGDLHSQFVELIDRRDRVGRGDDREYGRG